MLHRVSSAMWRSFPRYCPLEIPRNACRFSTTTPQHAESKAEPSAASVEPRKTFTINRIGSDTQPKAKLASSNREERRLRWHGEEAEPGYLLTLTTTTLLHQTLTALRRQHSGLSNHGAAHLKLFHHIPAFQIHRLNEIVSTFESFPVRASPTATRKGKALVVTFTHGNEEVRNLCRRLWELWARDSPQFRAQAPNRVPHRLRATIQYRWTEPSEHDESLETLNSQLSAIAALGGGGPRVTAPVEEGGGTLFGVATGLALFQVMPQRYKFLRRYNFADVPSRGWDAPESLSIPMLEGLDRPTGFI